MEESEKIPVSEVPPGRFFICVDSGDPCFRAPEGHYQRAEKRGTGLVAIDRSAIHFSDCHHAILIAA